MTKNISSTVGPQIQLQLKRVRKSARTDVNTGLSIALGRDRTWNKACD